MAGFFGARTVDLGAKAGSGGVADALLSRSAAGWRAGIALAGGDGLAGLAAADWAGLVADGTAGGAPLSVRAPVLFHAGEGLWGLLSPNTGRVTLHQADAASPPLATWAMADLAQVSGAPITLAAMAGVGQLGQGGMMALGLEDGRVLVGVPEASGAVSIRAEIPVAADAGLAGQFAGLTALASLAAGGQTYLLVAVSGADRVLAYRLEAEGGATLTGALGAAEGVGLALPAALATVGSGDGGFVVVAGQASSTLSVMELDAAGRLILRDQIMDGPDLRLGAVSEVRALSAGGRDLVLAGGADRGLSLMALGPDGRLYHLASTDAAPGAEFGSLTALEVVAEGEVLRILSAGYGIPGPSVTLLSVDLSDLGLIAEDWAIDGPTARNDILIATAWDNVLAGGGGADLFVFGPDAMAGQGTSPRVLDFQPGIDRLDLSGFPMLSNAGQIGITPTADGATLGFRGHTLTLHSAEGGPISAEDLGQAMLFDAMHAPILPSTPDSQEAYAARLAVALGVGADAPGRAGFFTFAGADTDAAPLPSWQDWTGSAALTPAPEDAALIASYFDLIL